MLPSTLAIDAALATLIGALGGVLITSLIALTTAILTHRWQEETRQHERADRLRTEKTTLRRDAYARYLKALDALETEIVGAEPWDDEMVTQFSSMDAEARTRAGRKRLREWRERAPEKWDEASAALNHVRLVAGSRVRSVFEEHVADFNNRVLVAVFSQDPMSVVIARNHENLIEEMRKDLGAEE